MVDLKQFRLNNLDHEPKDRIRKFTEALQRNGLEVSTDIDTFGNLNRVKTIVDKNSEKSGWYVFHEGDEFSAGAFGDWRTGEQQTWSSHNVGELNAEQRFRHQKQMEEIRATQERQQAREYEQAKSKANEQWIEGNHADPDHPYLNRKQIDPCGIRQAKNKLIVPVMNTDGEIQSLQFISNDGQKRFLTGGKIKGGRFTIGKPSHTIYICEGYSTGATIHKATGDQVVLCFHAGNLAAVAEDIRQREISARIIIAGDNDQFLPPHIGNVGANKAEEVAAQISADCKIPEFEDITEQPTDFNDLAILAGLEEVKQQLKAARPSRLNLRRLSDIGFNEQEVDWLIKDVLEANCLAVLFAQPSTYKTFLALDWALSLAAGKIWNDKRVSKPRRVVFINGEGQRGVMRRIHGWCKWTSIKLEDLDFYLSESAAKLFTDPEELITEIDALDKEIDLIVFDTLSRNSAGMVENSNDDMARVVANIDEIKNRYDCAALLIHHTPISESNRLRGASALNGAIDAGYCMARTSSGLVQLTCSKMKDFEEPTAMNFRPTPINLGFNDQDGIAVSSLYLDPAIASDAALRLGKNQESVYQEVVMSCRKKMKREKSQPWEAKTVWVNFDDICDKVGLDRKRKSEVKWSLIDKNILEFDGVQCRPMREIDLN